MADQQADRMEWIGARLEAASEWSEWNPDGSYRCHLCGKFPCRCGVPKAFSEAYDDLAGESRDLLAVAEAARELADAWEGPDLLDRRVDDCAKRHRLKEALDALEDGDGRDPHEEPEHDRE